jgi:hypothetical protein
MIIMILSILATASSALDDAALRYNKLDGITAPVAISATPGIVGRGQFILPAWTKDVALQPTEAAALVALGEFSERPRLSRRKWTAPEYVAGWALENATQSGRRSAGNQGMDPNRGEPPFVKSDRAPAAMRYQRRLAQLSSCTGALASSLAKLRAARPTDDFTQFAFRVRQQLGTAMLPPDASCLTAS